MNAKIATSLTVALLTLSAQGAYAAGIKSQVSESVLAEYCATAGVGTETTTTLPGLGGTDVTGTVHCELEDLIVGSDDVKGANDDLNDDSEDDDLNDDSGDDDSGEDDSSDDSGDDDSGSDDDGGDDNSGEGGGDDD